MKIAITYQKEDLIQLVLAEVRRKGLRPTEGQEVGYKGKLEVKLEVEVDDIAPPEPPKAVEPIRTPTIVEAVDDAVEAIVDESENISAVLRQSEQLKRTKPAVFDAPQPRASLGPNAFTEWDPSWSK